MPPNLTDDDLALVARLLRDMIAADPFPLSLRIKRSSQSSTQCHPRMPERWLSW
jgi:hypothetical protein